MSPTPARLNPFPGLRPFTQEEDYLFFGREEQTIELLQRLSSHRFVAVVGSSGSGKSSLVRCGLLSELLGGRMLEAGAAWEIAVTHPGGNPLALLTDALLEADLYDRETEHVRENLLATLSRSHFGLVEAVKQAGLGEGTNFLLVVDQFEEIFRFHEAGQRQQEAANEFVSLLLEAAAQKEVPIYVVLTMRSDFIGECGQFEGLAEMVNRGEFLIPRLSRDQFKRVIEGPIKVAGGQIAPRLLQRLLNDLGQQADQLPCLQHALMRTWDVWAAKGGADALDLEDYQRIGKMSQALSLHADEIYESLASERQRDLCKGIFQALTVEESNSRGIRRPQRLGRLCLILEVSTDELVPIIDAYRRSGVTFLMPSPEVTLTEQTIVDISHESLMRVWTRLRQWVEEETQAAGIYHRLSESADLHAQGRAGLYRDPELGIALAWRESKRPNAAWAERYRPGFNTAVGYLDASHQASKLAEQAVEAAQRHELEQAQMLAQAERARAETETRAARRLRMLLAGAAVVAVFALAASVVAVRSWSDADRAKQAAQLSEQAAQQNELAAKKEAARASTQELAARQARSDAEENLARARGAIDDYMIKISESQLLSTPGLQPLRAELLASASQFYEDILKKNPNNPDLQAGLAAAFYRVGFVRFDTGELEESAKSLERAAQSYTSALTLQPGKPELQHGLASSWFMLAAVYLRTDTDKTSDYAKRAARIWEALIKEGGTDLRYYKELARAYNILGITYSSERDQEESFLSYQKSLSIRLSLISEHPNDAQLIHGLAESFGNISTQIADGELRLQMSLRSIDYAQRAHQLQPQNVEYALDSAGFYSSAAQLLVAHDRNAEAQDIYRRELDHIGKFVRGNPSVVAARQLLLNPIGILAGTASSAADSTPYVQLFRDSLALSTALPKESAEDYIIDAQVQSLGARWLGTALKKESLQAFTEEETKERAALLDRSLQSLKQAVAAGFKDPQRLSQNPSLATVRTHPDFNQVIASLDGTGASGTGVAKATVPGQATAEELQRLEQDRATSYLAFGTLESVFHRNQQARKSLEQALSLRETLATAEPTNQQRQVDFSLAQSALAKLLWNEGDFAGARKLFDLRTASLEHALQQAPDDHGLQSSLASHHRAMADSFASMALWDEAVPHYTQAMELEKAVPNPSVDAGCAEILAPAMQLLTGADEAYRTGCERVLQKFGGNIEGEYAVRIARLYALRPIAADKVSQIVALAERATYHWHAYTHGLVLYRAGRFQDAIQILETAERAKTYRGIQQDQFVLAMAYFQLGQRDRARSVLDAVNALALGAMDGGWHSPGALLDVDWIVLHREANELIYGDSYSGQERMRRGRAYSQLGNVQQATVEFAKVVERLPDYPLGHFAYARALAETGNKEQTEQVLQKARLLFDEQQVKQTVGDVDCWRLHAETLSRLGRHAEAIPVFRYAIAAQSIPLFKPGTLVADRDRLLDLHVRLSDELKSVDQVEAAKQVDKEFALLINVLKLKTVIQNAEDLLKTEATENQDASARISGIDHLLAANEKSLASIDPLRWNVLARLHQLRANVLREDGRQSEAAADLAAAQDGYEKALSRFPSDGEVAGNLADVLVQSDVKWTVIKPTSLQSEWGTTLTLKEDGSILASGVNPDYEVYTVVADAGLAPITAIRLETLPDPSMPIGGSGRARGNGNSGLSEWKVMLQPQESGGAPTLVQWKDAVSDHRLEPAQHHAKRAMHIGLAIDGDSRTCWETWPKSAASQSAVFHPDSPISGGPGRQLKIILEFKAYVDHNLGRFRLSVTSDPNAPERDKSRLAALKLTDPWQKLAAARFAFGDQPAVDKLLELHPAAAVGIGDLYAADQNWEGAVTEYSRAIMAETRDANLFAKRAVAYEKLEQWDSAVADWTRASQLQHDIAFRRFKKAAAVGSQLRWQSLAQGGGAGSIDIVDGALELNSTVATGTDYHVQASQGHLQFENGAEYVIRFQMKSPDASPIHFTAQIGEPDWHAIGPSETFTPPTEFKEYEFTFVAHDVHPTSNRITFSYGTKQGKFTVKDFVILKKFSQEDLDIALRKAKAQQGQSDQAISAFVRVLPLARNHTAKAALVAAAASRTGMLEKLVESAPNDGVLQVAAARQFDKQGNAALADTARTTARKLFEQQIAKEPNHQAAAGELADLLLAMPTKPLLPTSEAEGVPWLVTTTQPSDDWIKSDFDDSTWKKEVGGFGTWGPPGFVSRTTWNTHDIWLRRTFEWQPATSGPRTLVLRLINDDAAEIYFNGQRVVNRTAWTPNYITVLPEASAVETLRAGTNSIAVHCHQDEVNQNIDVGISEVPYEPHEVQQRLAGQQLTDPWEKLAAAYLALGDQPALDKVLEQHPAAAIAVGELYAADNQWDRAITEYSKLITPDTNNAALLAKRAKAYGATAKWDLAKADWLQATQHQPDLAQTAVDQFSQSGRWNEAAPFALKLVELQGNDSVVWLRSSPVLALADDRAVYIELCNRMAKQFADSVKPEDSERIVKASLLRATSIDPAKLPVDKFAKALDDATAPDWFNVWGWAARALWAHRSGDYESAVKYVANSERHQPGELTRTMNLAVLAMAQHQLQHPQEARAALDEASKLLTRFRETPNLKGIPDTLIAEILFQEADALINGKPQP